MKNPKMVKAGKKAIDTKRKIGGDLYLSAIAKKAADKKKKNQAAKNEAKLLTV